MFNFRNLFTFDKWAYVKTFDTNNSQYTYYIHLYESRKGKRRAEYKCNGDKYDINRPNGWLKETALYQGKIYRWLKGRADPDIPRYSQVAEEDTANLLRGTIK